MTGIIREIKFDNLDYDNIQKWCTEFTHWNFVQKELADNDIQLTMVDNMVKYCIVRLMEELDEIEYGEPKEVEDD